MFTVEEARRASDEWGANCGPGALAGVLGLSLDAVRPHLRGFDQKRYTNPSMMRGALRSIGAQHDWRVVDLGADGIGWKWPVYGLARIQWCGPWNKPGVPIAASYRHTHWIGVRTGEQDRRTGERPVEILDINCICVGGWVSLDEWSTNVVPWLLKQCEPKATGDWYATHVIEVSQQRSNP